MKSEFEESFSYPNTELVEGLLGDAGWDRESPPNRRCERDEFAAAAVELLNALTAGRAFVLDAGDIEFLASSSAWPWSRFVDPDLSNADSNPESDKEIVLWECAEHQVHLHGKGSSWEMRHDGVAISTPLLDNFDDDDDEEESPYEPEELDTETEMTVAERNHLLGRAQVAEEANKKAQLAAKKARAEAAAARNNARETKESLIAKLAKERRSSASQVADAHRKGDSQVATIGRRLEAEREKAENAATEERKTQAKLIDERKNLKVANTALEAAHQSIHRSERQSQVASAKIASLQNAIAELQVASEQKQSDIAALIESGERQAAQLVDLTEQLRESTDLTVELGRAITSAETQRLKVEEQAKSERENSDGIQRQLGAAESQLQEERNKSVTLAKELKALQLRVAERLPKRHQRRLDS